jgi:hypothetical protein
VEEGSPGVMKLGIACASGSYKGVFVHGVLDALEEAGRADVYAAASSSTLCAAFAAAGRLGSLGGARYWSHAWESYAASGWDISAAVRGGIRELLPAITPALFEPSSSRFAVAVSAVVTKEAAEITQGPGARRLGQQLVLATRTRDASWAAANLAGVLFDTAAAAPRFRLTADNLADVAYATTRMLHAWKTPAWIDGAPFVDASYTCSCPATALAEMGCRHVVVISPECGPVFTDFFQAAPLPQSHHGVPIRVVQPRRNLSEIGVDYLKATTEGFSAAHEEGRTAGRAFLAAGLP